MDLRSTAVHGFAPKSHYCSVSPSIINNNSFVFELRAELAIVVLRWQSVPCRAHAVVGSCFSWFPAVATPCSRRGRQLVFWFSAVAHKFVLVFMQLLAATQPAAAPEETH